MSQPTLASDKDKDGKTPRRTERLRLFNASNSKVHLLKDDSITISVTQRAEEIERSEERAVIADLNHKIEVNRSMMGRQRHKIQRERGKSYSVLSKLISDAADSYLAAEAEKKKAPSSGRRKHTQNSSEVGGDYTDQSRAHAVKGSSNLQSLTSRKLQPLLTSASQQSVVPQPANMMKQQKDDLLQQFEQSFRSVREAQQKATQDNSMSAKAEATGASSKEINLSRSPRRMKHVGTGGDGPRIISSQNAAALRYQKGKIRIIKFDEERINPEFTVLGSGRQHRDNNSKTDNTASCLSDEEQRMQQRIHGMRSKINSMESSVPEEHRHLVYPGKLEVDLNLHQRTDAAQPEFFIQSLGYFGDLATGDNTFGHVTDKTKRQADVGSNYDDLVSMYHDNSRAMLTLENNSPRATANASTGMKRELVEFKANGNDTRFKKVPKLSLNLDQVVTSVKENGNGKNKSPIKAREFDMNVLSQRELNEENQLSKTHKDQGTGVMRASEADNMVDDLEKARNALRKRKRVLYNEREKFLKSTRSQLQISQITSAKSTSNKVAGNLADLQHIYSPQQPYVAVESKEQKIKLKKNYEKALQLVGKRSSSMQLEEEEYPRSTAELSRSLHALNQKYMQVANKQLEKSVCMKSKKADVSTSQLTLPALPMNKIMTQSKQKEQADIRLMNRKRSSLQLPNSARRDLQESVLIPERAKEATISAIITRQKMQYKARKKSTLQDSVISHKKMVELLQQSARKSSKRNMSIVEQTDPANKVNRSPTIKEIKIEQQNDDMLQYPPPSEIHVMSRNETKAILSSASAISAVTPTKAMIMKPQLAQSSKVLPIAHTCNNSREDQSSRERRRNLLERKSKALIACSSAQSLSMETEVHPIVLDHKLGDRELAREIPTVYLQTDEFRRTNDADADRLDTQRSDMTPMAKATIMVTSGDALRSPRHSHLKTITVIDESMGRARRSSMDQPSSLHSLHSASLQQDKYPLPAMILQMTDTPIIKMRTLDRKQRSQQIDQQLQRITQSINSKENLSKLKDDEKTSEQAGSKILGNVAIPQKPLMLKMPFPQRAVAQTALMAHNLSSMEKLAPSSTTSRVNLLPAQNLSHADLNRHNLKIKQQRKQNLTSMQNEALVHVKLIGDNETKHLHKRNDEFGLLMNIQSIQKLLPAKVDGPEPPLITHSNSQERVLQTVKSPQKACKIRKDLENFHDQLNKVESEILLRSKREGGRNRGGNSQDLKSVVSKPLITLQDPDSDCEVHVPSAAESRRLSDRLDVLGEQIEIYIKRAGRSDIKYSEWQEEEKVNRETLKGLLAMKDASRDERQETARLSSSTINDDRTHLNETLDMLSRSRAALPRDPKHDLSLTGVHAPETETFSGGGALNLERFSNMLTPRRKLKLLKEKIMHQLRASQPAPIVQSASEANQQAPAADKSLHPRFGSIALKQKQIQLMQMEGMHELSGRRSQSTEMHVVGQQMSHRPSPRFVKDEQLRIREQEEIQEVKGPVVQPLQLARKLITKSTTERTIHKNNSSASLTADDANLEAGLVTRQLVSKVLQQQPRDAFEQRLLQLSQAQTKWQLEPADRYGLIKVFDGRPHMGIDAVKTVIVNGDNIIYQIRKQWHREAKNKVRVSFDVGIVEQCAMLLSNLRETCSQVILLMEPIDMALSRINSQGKLFCHWLKGKLIDELQLPIDAIYVNSKKKGKDVLNVETFGGEQFALLSHSAIQLRRMGENVPYVRLRAERTVLAIDKEPMRKKSARGLGNLQYQVNTCSSQKALDVLLDLYQRNAGLKIGLLNQMEAIDDEREMNHIGRAIKKYRSTYKKPMPLDKETINWRKDFVPLSKPNELRFTRTFDEPVRTRTYQTEHEFDGIYLLDWLSQKNI